MKRALERYEQYLKRHFSHSSTAIHYRSDIKIFLRSQDGKQPDAITAADMDIFVDNQIKAVLAYVRTTYGGGAAPAAE